MKKLMMSLTILAFAVLTLSSGLLAQEKMDSKMEPKTHSKMDMTKDHCMMKHGKVYMVKDGKKTLMDKSMTLSNGTECSPDGTCKMKDGTTMKMKNGDMMDMDGTMIKMHKKGKMGSMKM